MEKQVGSMDIYKPEYGDCSNGGISSDCWMVRIWSGFDAAAPRNAVVIVVDKVMGRERVRAVPAWSGGRWSMFGGCCIYTSSGVVPHYGQFIPLHDRFET